MGHAGHERSHTHGHSHAAAHASAGRLRLVLGLLLAILSAEVVGGLWAGSLALLADAGHLLSDAAGVALALIAVAFANKPPTLARTFGFPRAEILAAVVNGMLLFAVGLGVIGFSVARLADPTKSDVGVMAAFGTIALVGNGIALVLLAGGAKNSLNVRRAYLEVLSDALGAVGVLAGCWRGAGGCRARPYGGAARRPGCLAAGRAAHPAAHRPVAAGGRRRAAGSHPRGLDPAEIRLHSEGVQGVVSCHDLHAWTITSGTPVLSAHVVVADECWDAKKAPEVLDRPAAWLSTSTSTTRPSSSRGPRTPGTRP